MKKNNISKDKRIVLSLDAGGTNFIFSAIQANKTIGTPIRLNPNSDNIERCIATIIEGFEQIQKQLPTPASAISFAFPGPADYPNGIIGDLPNLEAFRGGVALGPILEHHFDIPVFINNDANLFTYGEALFGFLQQINQELQTLKSSKRFYNLIGITLGTGFGVGLVSNGQFIVGNNSCGGESWLLRNIIDPNYSVEKHIGREGIRKSYAEKAKLPLEQVGMPKDIGAIAKGLQEGNQAAAIATFNDFGLVLGESIAIITSLFDGMVVLGGGISGAYDLFAPAMFAQLKSSIKLQNGRVHRRLFQEIFDLEIASEKEKFLIGNQQSITLPNTDKKVSYDASFRMGIGLSKQDTSEVIALGAYAFAIENLD